MILPFGKSGMELYDLSSDPAEKKNLVTKHPDHVARLKKKATDIVLHGSTNQGAVQANDTGYWNSLSWITEMEYNARQSKNE